VCSDEPQSVHMCTKGSARRVGPGVMVFSGIVSGFYDTPVVCSVPDVGRASATCASYREQPKSRGVRRHEAAALTGLEKAAVVDAENPRELSGDVSAAGWLHAPGIENGLAGGGVDGSGDGGGSCRGNVVGVAVVAAGNSCQVVLPTTPMEKMDRMPHQRRSALARALRACIVRGLGGSCSSVSLIFLSNGTATQILRRCSQLVLVCLRLTCGTFEETAGHQPVPQAHQRKVACRRCSYLPSLLTGCTGKRHLRR
jgi:hypothetical protein